MLRPLVLIGKASNTCHWLPLKSPLKPPVHLSTLVACWLPYLNIKSKFNVLERTLPYWNDVIVPQLRANKKILIAAHGNSLRGIVKHLDNMTDEEIMGCNLPTGIPFVYELNEDLKVGNFLHNNIFRQIINVLTFVNCVDLNLLLLYLKGIDQ